jgi:hypothetical protein
MKGKLFRKLVLLCGAGLIPLCAFGQTAKGSDYASQFDAYAGFTYLESPQINLAERGFHIQTGYNWKPWLAMGFDYSNANGTLNLIPAYLPTALKNEAESSLNILIKNGYLPANYVVAVPTNTFTQTFAAGPSLVIRRVPHIAILLHPSFGALRELATPHPSAGLIQAIVTVFFPGKQELDWVPFYGFGGGIDFGVTKHVGIRMHTDVVYDHVLSDFLGNGHWTIRASIGPSFHFGKNIEK